MGISVPMSIWISSNVHTTLRANLWLHVGSGRFSSGLGSGNGGQDFKTEQIISEMMFLTLQKHNGQEPQKYIQYSLLFKYITT
jgi:hypothetical protein